jgi:hypothetical protein
MNYLRFAGGCGGGGGGGALSVFWSVVYSCVSLLFEACADD